MRFLSRIFSIKAVPSLSWSSEFPLNTKPRLKTMVMLIIGLFLFGLGEAIIIGSGSGVSPWTVLAQGISTRSDLSIGMATFFISIAILVFWIPLKQVPGIGTILNAIIIASAIDLTLPYLPQPDDITFKIIQACFGILVVGLGSGIYLCSNLGPGPRDGLMIGLQKQTNTSLPAIRTIIELSAVISGWLLGGVVGVGTILFVFGIGPCVGIGLTLVEKVSKNS
ncbi:hypothetical protein N9442_04330 [Gammaproteobacteria bacterium]|nr:hypothetical protein [Gammaproteobacteria bacterium]MDC0545335.1 hypothetical protein [Gammaproteobacteria bacterium]MDC0591126.1 hypothetical protein [Gammaproteobacteria bacterium]